MNGNENKNESLLYQSANSAMLTFDVTYASTEVAPAILPVLVTVTLYCTEPTENSSLIDILTGDSDNNSVLNTHRHVDTYNLLTTYIPSTIILIKSIFTICSQTWCS